MLQPARLGQGAGHVAQNGLDDDGRHIAPRLFDGALQRLKIVVGHGDDQLVDGLGDPGTGRRRDGAAAMAQPPQRRRDRGKEHIVVHAVVLALELDDFLPAGVRPGNAQGVHRRLAAGIGKAHLVHAGAHLHDALGDLDLPLVGQGVDGAALDGLRHLFHDDGVPVAEDDRAKAHPVVDVALVVKVPDVGALGARHTNVLALAPIAKVG